jgi:flagellar hook-associated protein 3 FlgL
MRISTLQIYDSGTARISELQSALATTQLHIATGKSLLTPSDDPVAAAQAIAVSQAQSLNTQYASNRVQVRNSVGLVEGTLSSVTDALQSVRDLLVSADNATFDDAQRNILATELTSRFAEILGLANTRDAQGNYLFSGYQLSTAPFVETATGASYQGDSGQQFVQVDSNRQLALSNPGDSVFQGGGQDVFQTLKDMITLLQTPVVTQADQDALAAGLVSGIAEIDKALDNVLNVRASLGNRLQELDTLDLAGTDRAVQYSAILSEIQDLDYTQAITQLSLQETTLEAAQQSFVRTTSLSLFNFL